MNLKISFLFFSDKTCIVIIQLKKVISTHKLDKIKFFPAMNLFLQISLCSKIETTTTWHNSANSWFPYVLTIFL